MKDFFDKDLKVGDIIVVGNRNYAELEIGAVIKITAKKIRISKFGSLYSLTSLSSIDSKSVMKIEFDELDKVDLIGFEARYFIPKSKDLALQFETLVEKEKDLNEKDKDLVMTAFSSFKVKE